jgi:nucleotidyltransferase/DNA polymerase involved in DNA repair
MYLANYMGQDFTALQQTPPPRFSSQTAFESPSMSTPEVERQIEALQAQLAARREYRARTHSRERPQRTASVASVQSDETEEFPANEVVADSLNVD